MAAPPPVLDHVVVDVRDRIDEAAECFRSIGFKLTPRGRHTLGSVNHLAMFATDYLELLGFPGDVVDYNRPLAHVGGVPEGSLRR